MPFPPSGLTSRLSLPYPLETDVPDIPTWALALETILDSQMVVDEQGTFAGRPAAGVPGRYYYATNTQVLYRDNGTTWTRMAYVRAQGFTSSGTFTVPDGITLLEVVAIGGGGGGGAGWVGGYNGSGATFAGGGGGGGGGANILDAYLDVTPGQVLTVTVAAGGAGGAATTTGPSTHDGASGGASTVVNGALTLVTTAGSGPGLGGGGFGGVGGGPVATWSPAIQALGGSGGIALYIGVPNTGSASGVGGNGTGGGGGQLGTSFTGPMLLQQFAGTQGTAGAGGAFNTGTLTCPPGTAGTPPSGYCRGGNGGGCGCVFGANTYSTPNAVASANTTAIGAGGNGGGGGSGAGTNGVGSPTAVASYGGAGGNGGPGYVEIRWVG